MGRWSADNGRARFHCTTVEPERGRPRVAVALGARVSGPTCPTATQMGAARSLVITTRGRLRRYHPTPAATTTTRPARAGAMRAGRRRARATGDSWVEVVVM